MSGRLPLPSANRAIDELDAEFLDIRRRIRTRAVPKNGVEIIEKEFTPSGSAVAVTPRGRRYYPWATVTLYEVLVSLDTAGTSTTTVKIYINGGLWATINLAAGDNLALVAMDNILQANIDYLQVEVSAAGAGAKDLTVQARMRRVVAAS